MSLAEILRAYHPVSDDSVIMLEDVCLEVPVHKREYVVRQGNKVEHLFFIAKGLFRGVHVSDEGEDTLFFGVPGDPFTSMHSFAHDEPAEISLQALEESVVYRVSLRNLRRLINERHDLLLWWNAVLVEQLYALERRYVAIGTSDAETRYENLLRVRSTLMNRIPVKFIAQYLSVAPETLSRIRRNIFQKKGRIE